MVLVGGSIAAGGCIASGRRTEVVLSIFGIKDDCRRVYEKSRNDVQ